MADAPQMPSYFMTEEFPREGERGLFDGLELLGTKRATDLVIVVPAKGRDAGRGGVVRFRFGATPEEAQ
ncbi:MAG: hypothetical protein IT300_15000 [Dehalococcoidia bacterium]|nr:hypothetical protein [Dehalococcoidia bacterium]